MQLGRRREHGRGASLFEPRDVEAIHDVQIATFGGAEGFIDRGVVQSALFAPQADYVYGHADVAGVAAAYLWYFAASQGFREGNKRTAVHAALEFLAVNGYAVECDLDGLFALTMRVAEHRMGKADVADWFRPRLVPLT